MAEKEEQALNYIEETVLKKRKHSEDWAIRRRQQLLERQWKIKQDKKLAFKKPEDFIKEYRSKQMDLVKMKQRVKRRKTSTASSSKLIFVIRIQGNAPVHPQIQKILRSFGLKKIYSGVFLKATEGTLAMLNKVEPYVTYGYPNLKNVRDLIFKKGLAKVEKERVPLTDNNVIEQALGQHGILCLEDMVHEIHSVGRHFKEVTRFLWPFSLAKPQDGFSGKKNLFKNGGDSGNREENINELIAKMT
ncbi:60S ribosomal protein L7-1-like [Chenopodium quinoa]|uniref:60S ribosomal protein L7 n=1 Tax=Chenopodium quinoa TaxID=63459 RepID=A0A803LQ52_CHEQI|nr:60S ribosomal protein L7-1-like [Chenopodium quinoa]